jgi:hypothetical protein
MVTALKRTISETTIMLQDLRPSRPLPSSEMGCYVSMVQILRTFLGTFCLIFEAEQEY